MLPVLDRTQVDMVPVALGLVKAKEVDVEVPRPLEIRHAVLDVTEANDLDTALHGQIIGQDWLHPCHGIPHVVDF